VILLGLFRGRLDYSVWQIIANFTMLQKLLGLEDIQGLYWTLTFEFLFYIACVFLFLAKIFKDPFRYVIFIYSVLFSLGLLCVLSLTTESVAQVSWKLAAASWHLVFMFVGYFIRLNYDSKISKPHIFCGLTASVCGFLLYCVVLNNVGYWHPLLGPVALFTSSIGAVIVFIFALYSKFLSKLFSALISVELGKISYSIYLFQFLGISLAVSIYDQFFGLAQASIVFAIAMGLTVMISYVSFYLIEKPFIAVGRYFSQN